MSKERERSESETMAHALDDTAHNTIREAVRSRYAAIASSASPGCGPAGHASSSTVSCCAPASPCCGPASGAAQDELASTASASPALSASSISAALGYSSEDLASVPEGANLALGCGNPHAIASLKEGETVLDLGSGAGFDCFLAARAVGPSGHVIGVDMTPEMIALARDNARKSEYANVEFRLGEIEHLPIGDRSVDVIISNCVINLSPDKATVFQEAFRVLKPGGRLAISDVVAMTELPREWKEDPSLLSGCISGAVTPEELKNMLREAGFEDIVIAPKQESREFIREWQPGARLEDYVISAYITARKPGGK